jgi:hypothetical protein
MDEKQFDEFMIIVGQCASDQSRSINVASKIRSDAIMAAGRELVGLRKRVAELEDELENTVRDYEALR